MSLKSKIKRILFRISGKYSHLRNGVRVKKKWYGNSYGGFYVNPELISHESVVYSFGIGEDISFDKTMIANHDCKVFGFDPTPKSIQWIKTQATTANFTFLDFGISDQSGRFNFFLPKNKKNVSGSFVSQDNVDEQQTIAVTLKSLQDISRELGHKRIDVLKMDIEGAEYQVIDSILNSKILIGQLLVEFHDRYFTDGKQKTIDTIGKLKQHGFEVFGISDSFEEISFVNKALLT